MKIRTIFSAISLLLFPLLGHTQSITITGQVIDNYYREPVWGAIISVKNDGASAVYTDENGYYSINADPDGILVASFIGYSTIEVPINGRTSIVIEMDYEDSYGSTYSIKGLRWPSHELSVLAAYGFSGWGAALDYSYLPPIKNSYCFFNKLLYRIYPAVRVQDLSLPDSDVRIYPYLKVSIPVGIPMFTSRQKLYPFAGVGYYFDTDFNNIVQHGWGIGGGFRTQLAFINLRGRAHRCMTVSLTAGYTAFMGAEKKHNAYLGLRFYLSRIFVFE